MTAFCTAAVHAELLPIVNQLAMASPLRGRSRTEKSDWFRLRGIVIVRAWVDSCVPKVAAPNSTYNWRRLARSCGLLLPSVEFSLAPSPKRYGIYGCSRMP